jgi:sugar phosphate permease
MRLGVTLCLRRYSAWLNVLNINLQSFNFSQEDSGWVGFGSALAGAAGGLLSGFIADKLPKNLTRLIACLYLCSCAAMLWFTLICFQLLPYSLPAVYISSISVGLFMYCLRVVIMHCFLSLTHHALQVWHVPLVFRAHHGDRVSCA